MSSQGTFRLGVVIALVAAISGVTLNLGYLVVSQATAQTMLPLPLPSDSPSHSRASTELLTNISFELDTDTDKLPDGWVGKRTDQQRTDRIKCNDTNTGKIFAYTGNCAFMFRGNPDGSSSRIQQTITDTSVMQHGMLLSFSAYVSPKGTTSGTNFGLARIRYSNGTDQKLTLAIPVAAVSPHANQTLGSRSSITYQLVMNSQTLNIPAGASITQVQVRLTYAQNKGRLMIDDVSLRVESPSMTATYTPSISPTHTATMTASATATATLTPSITPTITPTLNALKLIASDPGEFDSFGYALTVSGDSNTALIGAYRDSIGGAFDQGSVYVYVRNGTTWTQQARLTANDGAAFDRFGISVSLSSNGNLALVGAWGDDVGANQDQGAAYVFVRNGTSWTQQAKLTASDGAVFTNFGFAVALSAVGDTAVIGAPRDNTLSGNQGAAYIFTRSGNTWTQQAKLVASDGAGGDFMGAAVAISATGSVALIGAYGDSVGVNTSQGSAYVFSRNNGVWSSGQKLVANDGTQFDLFGNAVALSHDGTTALIGAYFDTLGTKNPLGAAYVFKRDASFQWQQQAKLTADDGSGADLFGISVALAPNGTLALIGAYQEMIGTNSNQGAAYVYGFNGTVWSQQQKLTANDGAAGDYFGNRVALSADASYAIIGAPGDDVEYFDQGSAYVFDLP